MNTKLSTSASYHLRKVLHKYRDRAKFIVAQNAGLAAHAMADLNEVIESLYLEDEAIVETMNQLEILVSTHQTLTEQGEIYKHTQLEIERKMLWLLGFLVLEDK